MSRNTGLCIVWAVFWIALFGYFAASDWAAAYKKANSATVVCEAVK